MNDDKLLNSLKEMAKDEEFLITLGKSENEEIFNELLKTKHIEVDDSDAKILFDAMRSAQLDELSEDNLESVSGGWVGWALVGGAAFLYGVYKGFTSKC